MDRSQYIARCVVFSKKGDQISLVDLLDPDAEPHTYETWLGLVVSLADGQHTIQEIVDYTAGYYSEDAPETLAATIESAVERLAETGTVLLSEEQMELPYYLSHPAERLDIPEAIRLMEEDRYKKENADLLD